MARMLLQVAGVGRNSRIGRGFPPIEFLSVALTEAIQRAVKIDTSDWDYRGWTLQERLFSRRLLMLNGRNGLASWVCRSCQWVEEVQRPSEKTTWTQKHMDRFTNPHSNTPGLPLWSDMYTYGQLLSNYSGRILTFDGDVLDAFVGIMTVTNPLFPGGFHCGLPELFFDLMMLWMPTHGVRRRLSGNGNNAF